MKNVIPYRYNINLNVYVLYEILECITNKLFLPDPYYSKARTLATELGNSLFSFPKNCNDLNLLGQNVEITDFYQITSKKGNDKVWI